MSRTTRENALVLGAISQAVGALGLAAAGGYRLVRGIETLPLALLVAGGSLGGVLALGGARLLYAEATGRQSLTSPEGVAAGTLSLLVGSALPLLVVLTEPPYGLALAALGVVPAVYGLVRISTGVGEPPA
ncbi:hypothetical protein [Halorientalis pallida]|uniref:Uncharacterized protein n=1 Tax=Halorientalis pallida TaxID=2479928 RepID=A0A498L0W5_9EURY|nr:hypothetical protein [Halorientalis pallida]RXK50473.1 hypothetical protein EAF64_07965 [Halorientalis pallida]